jgi:hypothetical protein
VRACEQSKQDVSNFLPFCIFHKGNDRQRDRLLPRVNFARKYSRRFAKHGRINRHRASAFGPPTIRLRDLVARSRLKGESAASSRLQSRRTRENRANSDSETYDRLALSGRYFGHKFGRNGVCRYIVQIRAPIYVPTVSPFRQIPRRPPRPVGGIPSSPHHAITPCFGPLRASYTCIRSYRNPHAPPLDYSELSRK